MSYGSIFLIRNLTNIFIDYVIEQRKMNTSRIFYQVKKMIKKI